MDMQISPKKRNDPFLRPNPEQARPLGDLSTFQGLKSLLASTKLVLARHVQDAAEKLLAKLQRNETAVGAPAQAQERRGSDGMVGFKRWGSEPLY